jgi:glycosyltransferase involved in cell wall biosynthesis
MLDVLRAYGARVHCIVNSWENFRITPMAEEIGATWSVGPYWYPLTRRRLTPIKMARMAWEILRVSGHLLRESRRIRATHVFIPDFLTAIRNGPALLWLRARGTTVIAKLGNAPDEGRFYRLLWRWVVNPLIDVFVCNSEFTRGELVRHGSQPEGGDDSERYASPKRQAAAADAERIPRASCYVGQIIPDKGSTSCSMRWAILRSRGIGATLDVVGDMDGWESPSFRGYRARLRERANCPDLQGVVTFLGYREEVPVLMARASVHCCPSLPAIREAFGLVVL